MTSPIWMSARPDSLAIWPARHAVAACRGTVGEDADRGYLAFAAAAEPDAVADRDGTGEHPGVRDFVARRAAFDLENTGRDWAVGVPVCLGQQAGELVQQRVDARARDGGTEVHRVCLRVPDLRGQLLVEPLARCRRLVIEVGGQDGVVVFGQDFGQPRSVRDARLVGDEGGLARAKAGYRAHGDDRWCQPLGDIGKQALIARAAAVDLVDEEQRRDAQALQRTPQDAGLRLDALDRRDHQHDTVQHAQRAFHLGNEIRVAGRVDQVDGRAVDRERDDGGLDRDPALALQLQRVRLGRARVDAAGLVDDSSGVEQPLRQRCLAGVNMCEDPQIQCSARHAPHPPNRPTDSFRWTRTLLASLTPSAPWGQAALAGLVRHAS